MRTPTGYGLLLLLLCISLDRPTAAQEPFSRIGLQFHATANVNRTAFHEFWEAGRGGGLTITTPFYGSTLEMGATVHRYHASTDVAGFGVVWSYAGLSRKWPIFKAVSIQPGIRLGIYRMSFDDAETAFYGVATESELTMSTGLTVQCALLKYLMVFARVDYLRVHTNAQLHFWYASSGLAFDFAAGQRWRTLWE